MTTRRQSKKKMTICCEDMEQRARALVESHSLFFGRGRLFEFQYSEEVLVVRGCVPTYYLKQVLQSALKELEGIRLIDNQVRVDASEEVFTPHGRQNPC